LKSLILRKILLMILAVSLGGIIISGVIINFQLNQQFRYYVERNETVRQEQVVQELAEMYREFGGWQNLPPNLRPSRTGVFIGLRYVTDNAGRVVMEARHGMGMMPPPPPDTHPLKQLPVMVENKQVGAVYFGETPFHNFISRQDEIFRRTINRSILLAILITGLIATLVAVLFARRLSRPITAMSQSAKEMTAGNLEVRVHDLPHDELGELGESLNRLAERLRQVEGLRQKMTADVAHDLRTPLTTIRGHLEGMIDTVIPSSRENFESLLEEVNRLTVLVEDLQEIALADRAAYRFQLEPIDLNAFLAEMVRKKLPLFKKKGVVLEYHPAGPVIVTADRNALAKVFDNLLANAYKFTPSKKKVEVRLEHSGDWAEAIVADQGIGIAPEDLPFIFERFYRTDRSRNRESGGFGLGLTIVKELVEALEGTVRAESEIDKGSTFRVKLPLAK
jgi:two-component system sensor histidine kinase BaeS